MKLYNLILILLSCMTSLSAQYGFVHTATKANTNGPITEVDSKYYKGKGRKVIVEQTYHGSKVYNDHAIAVSWKQGKLQIFNQDGSPMPLGAKFNVSYEYNAIEHVVNVANTTNHMTTIDDLLFNDKPNAKLVVTAVYNGVSNPNAIGVYYSGGHWHIFNQNREAMTPGMTYNVGMCDKCLAFAASSPTQNYQALNHQALNGKPNRLLFVTQHWDGINNPNHIGVWYSSGKWHIYNQNRAPMPRGAKFWVRYTDPDPSTMLTAMSTDLSLAPLQLYQADLHDYELSLSGIAVDNDAKSSWGDIRYWIEEQLDNGTYKRVETSAYGTTGKQWSTPRNNPIVCHPYPKGDKRINNIRQAFTVRLDKKKVDQGKYRIHYEMKMACKHKDNFMAAEGDHSMGGYESGKIAIRTTKSGLAGKQHKTKSNRLIIFRPQFTIDRLN